MTGHVAGTVAAGTFRPQPLTLAETPLASDLAGAALVSDSELVMRTRQGDRRSFGTLYLRHLDAAWRVACTSAATAADAEDAVAEGFAKVFAALPRMVDRDLAFRPYLLACIRNAAVDRHRRTRKLDLRDEVPEHAVAAGDPDEIVLADLDRNLVGEALQSLPERWRTVLWLTVVEGMTPTEVSAVIGIRPSAVSALSYRAREGLRQAYLRAHVRVEAKAACRYTVDRLGPYVRNKLPGGERDKVQAHLDGCTTCRQRRDELADVNASLLGSLIPIPLLLSSSTQPERLSLTRLGKGTRKAKPPAKAAQVAQRGTPPTVPRTRTLVVALLLAVSGGVAVQSAGPGGRVAKTLDPVAIPKLSSPATPPSDESTPTEDALPRPVPTPTATPPARRAARAPARRDAPLLSPQPQSVQAPSPAPEPAATLTPPLSPPPDQAPPPPTPTPPPAVAAVKISVGEGDSGAVVALSIPSDPAENPRPAIDVTVGRTPLVGNAPPSDGTGVGVSLPSAAAQAESVSDEAALVAKINDLRAGRGLSALQVNESLVAKARAWSAEMASAGGIRHSTLSDGITEDWKKLGENVGMGASVDRLHAEFVASPRHYENLVDPDFGYVGIGIVRNGDTIYVSEVFMQLMPTKPAPAEDDPRSGLLASRDLLDGGPDAEVGPAPAKVAAHRFVDVGVRRVGVAVEQGDRLHDLAGLAVAALGDVVVDPGLLDGVQLAPL